LCREKRPNPDAFGVGIARMQFVKEGHESSLSHSFLSTLGGGINTHPMHVPGTSAMALYMSDLGKQTWL
jgi:hypothetical protein